MSKLEKLKEEWQIAAAKYAAAVAAVDDDATYDAAYAALAVDFAARTVYRKELERCQNLKN